MACRKLDSIHISGAPLYRDVEFQFVPHKDLFEGGAVGLFWACYINAPLDKSIYFLRESSSGELFWQQFSTQYYDHDSTVVHKDSAFEWFFDLDVPPRLFTEISQIRYSEPFFYGRFRNMV